MFQVVIQFILKGHTILPSFVVCTPLEIALWKGKLTPTLFFVLFFVHLILQARGTFDHGEMTG